jgi:hypothetical protein
MFCVYACVRARGFFGTSSVMNLTEGESNYPDPRKVSCYEKPLNTTIAAMTSQERDMVAPEIFDENKRSP